MLLASRGSADCMQGQLSQQEDDIRGLRFNRDALAAELHDMRIDAENAASRAEHQVSTGLTGMRLKSMVCYHALMAVFGPQIMYWQSLDSATKTP